MKKTLAIIFILTLVSSIHGLAQKSTTMVNLLYCDFEADKTFYTDYCWSFEGVSFNNTSPISGSFSGRTSQLSGNANLVRSPWTTFSGGGNISFLHKLSGQPYSSTIIKMKVFLINTSGITTDTLYSYQYGANATQTVSVTIPVTVNGTYQVIFYFKGNGGSWRGIIDEIDIQGDYASDPSNGCNPYIDSEDADGDGVADAEDAYPMDPYRAYNNFFPANGPGTLAFEDLWPSKGDYDLNDVVIGYRYQVVTNAANNVVEVFGTFALKASGAYLHNGFGFTFPGVSPLSVISTTGYDLESASGIVLASNGTETGQTNATFILFDDFLRLMPSPGGIGVNTMKDQSFVPYDTLQLTITFMENGVAGSGGPVNINTLNIAEFNPFIISGGERGREVHLPGYPPTDKVNAGYFGTADDDTNPASGKYYKTENNLPWALNIYSDFAYPIELADITTAYLKFAAWAESNGVQFPDWYLDKPDYRNTSNIY